MNNLFVVISAIGNQYGAFSYRERLSQLESTVSSIKQKVPEAAIWLYDASEDPLPDEDTERLSGLVDRSSFLYDDTYVRFLKYKSLDPSQNKFEKKTVGEIQCMDRFLEDLCSSSQTFDRVFKISGRYQLSDSFNLDDYKDKSGRCVLLDKEDWYGEHVFTMRLWSFDGKQLNIIRQLFAVMKKHTYETVTETKRLEIVELTFTKFIEHLKIPYRVVSRIGVCGFMGLGGNYIDQ